MDSQKIQFGTSGCREKSSFFTDQNVSRLANGIRRYLNQETSIDDGSIVIGYDTRKKSRYIANQIGGIISTDFRVLISRRPVPTPALNYYTKEHSNVKLAICATASHNPVGYNGVKIMDKKGLDLDNETTDKIEKNIPESADTNIDGNIETGNFTGFYVKRLTSKFKSSQKPLSELKVCYDAVNGSGSGVLERILEDLGADVFTIRSDASVGLDGVEPNPNVVSKQKIFNRIGNADIGFITDGDADRVKVIASDGILSNKDVFALCYEYLLQDVQQGDIVRGVGASSVVDSIAEDYDNEAYESKIGFKNISRKIKEKKAIFGGDSTDGYCYPEHLYNKDGIYTAVLLCICHMKKSLSDRVQDIHRKYGYRYTDKNNINCAQDDKKSVMKNIRKSRIRVDNETPDDINQLDGYKMYFGDSWLLIRPSGTEPKIRIYAESKSNDRTIKLVRIGTTIVQENMEN
jgi:phosphomannomutase